jgi:hypothetical protein
MHQDTLDHGRFDKGLARMGDGPSTSRQEDTLHGLIESITLVSLRYTQILLQNLRDMVGPLSIRTSNTLVYSSKAGISGRVLFASSNFHHILDNIYFIVMCCLDN